MIIFLIAIAALALVLQKLLFGRDLEQIEGDHRLDAQVVEPGERFHVRVSLKNKSRRLVPFLRVCERFQEGIEPLDCDVVRDVRGAACLEFTTWLRPRQSLTREIPLMIPCRGRYVLQQFELFGGDFLGLNEKEKTCGRFNEVVAAPEEIAIDRLDDMFGGFMGEVSVSRFILEDPVLTLGYREYTGREPMKMISWTQSARTGGLMVRKYDYTMEPTVAVVLNVDSELDEQARLLETCFSLARTVCSMLERRGVKYSFTSNSVLAGAPTDPGAAGEGLGQRHYMGVLEHLGRATYSFHTSMERLLENEACRGTAAGRILITPGGGNESVGAIKRLREASGGNLLVLRASEVVKW